MAILDETARSRFGENGYVVLRGLLDSERDLGPLKAEYELLLDTVATQLFSDGAVSSGYTDLPFGPRFCNLVKETDGRVMNYMDICMPQ